MIYDFTAIKNKVREIEDWLKTEYHNVRTGRATPLLLERIMVNAYNARVPLKQVAAITIDDPKTLRLNPWDKSQMKDIESAITAANLGVAVSGDENGFRLVFPDLTAEGRQKLLKAARAKFEEARTTLRQTRDKVWNEIQKNEREGKMSEDDKFRAKTELQKIIDRANQELEVVVGKKEKEILN